ncbi:MAG: trypsin-like peptidase domain-containing protein [Caldilineaceae bacterium]|nr:trypsin-like peptidase domain-containing protein [Caldilineaceae bacterium]
MRQWLISGLLVVALLSIGITLLAQDDSFEPSPHIYRVKAAGCTSAPEQRVQSGFRVTGQVGIFTALHGVLGCKTVIAEPGGDGQTFHDLSIGKVDIDHDVAVLWSRGLADEPLEGLVVITETLQIDQKASYQVIGYPLNVFRQKPTVDVKILERTELGNLLTNDAILVLEERMSPALDAKVLSIQTHLIPGHSGAPLLNQANQVVAIGNGGLDAGRIEMGWAIPWDELDLSTIVAGVSQEVSWSERRRLREIGDSDSGYIFSYSTPEQLTTTLTAPVSSTVEAAVDLRVVDEGLADQHTYYIEGNNTAPFTIGDDLAVYAEPNPDLEIAIALLKVVGKSSTTLTAQAILVDPRYEIRTRMRVDNNLGHLSESQLIPVFEYVDGYLLRPTRIRLRPDHGLAVGAQLQALA